MKQTLVATFMTALSCTSLANAEELPAKIKACIENPNEACVVNLTKDRAETGGSGKHQVLAYAAIASAYQHNDRPKDAAANWQLTYDAALSLEKGEDRDKAFSDYVTWSGHRANPQEVIKAAEEIGNDEIKSKALLSFSKSMADAGKFDHAFLVLARQIGFLQLAQGYAHLASAQARAGDVDGAIRSFTVFTKAASHVVEQRYYATGFPDRAPNSDSVLRDIAVAQINAGLKKDATKTLSQIERDESFLYAKVAIAAAQAEMGKFQAARRTINGMTRAKKGHQLDKRIRHELRDVAFMRVAVILAEQDDLKKALETAGRIKQDDIYDSAIMDIAEASAAQGIDTVLSILRKRKSSEPVETAAPRPLALAYLNSGNREKARPYFQQMMSEDDSLQFPTAVVIKWSNIGSVLHNHGDYEEAERVMAKTLAYIRKSETRGMYPHLASIVVLHLSNQKRFGHAVATAVSIKDPTYRPIAFNHILTELLANQSP